MQEFFCGGENVALRMILKEITRDAWELLGYITYQSTAFTKKHADKFVLAEDNGFQLRMSSSPELRSSCLYIRGDLPAHDHKQFNRILASKEDALYLIRSIIICVNKVNGFTASPMLGIAVELTKGVTRE
jgi:hypothetical protein